MGTNNTKPKNTTAKRTAKKTAAPKTIVVAPALKPTRAPKSAATRPVARKPAAKAKRATPRASYTLDDVALRAYFIAEKRQAHGLPGEPESDWLEAERQLRTEGPA
jgi:hypothetical protein